MEMKGTMSDIQKLPKNEKPDARERLALIRHSVSHVMAQAVTRLFPGTRVAIGPAVENGFYYDFQFPQPLGVEDLPRIEAEMRRFYRW